MSRRFTAVLEEEQYEQLVELSELLSVTVSELIRRGVDIILGRNGSPPQLWRDPGDDFVPRRPGVKFGQKRRKRKRRRRRPPELPDH